MLLVQTEYMFYSLYICLLKKCFFFIAIFDRISLSYCYPTHCALDHLQVPWRLPDSQRRFFRRGRTPHPIAAYRSCGRISKPLASWLRAYHSSAETRRSPWKAAEATSCCPTHFAPSFTSSSCGVAVVPPSHRRSVTSSSPKSWTRCTTNARPAR